MMRTRDLGWLAGFLAASFGAAAIGGAVTAPAVRGWYRTLRKPSWTPPAGVFAPVWTILYLHMAVAAWLVRRGVSKNPEQRDTGRLALGAWALQLLLNVGWSAAFFGTRSPVRGLLTIAPLWAAIAATVVLAGRVTRLAALLLAPYLLWTTFASALNFRVWQLNRVR